MRFVESLSKPGFGAIAEFKRRSPSAGDIKPGARVEDVAPAYQTGGARAVSVLVDDAFAGSVGDLRAARATVDLPLLAKGFFSTEEHLLDVREAGATPLSSSCATSTTRPRRSSSPRRRNSVSTRSWRPTTRRSSGGRRGSAPV